MINKLTTTVTATRSTISPSTKIIRDDPTPDGVTRWVSRVGLYGDADRVPRIFFSPRTDPNTRVDAHTHARGS